MTEKELSEINCDGVAGKPMPARVEAFLYELQQRGFEIRLGTESGKPNPRTWRILWRGLWIAMTNPGCWTKRNPRLFLYRFGSPKSGAISHAPSDFDTQLFASQHGIDPDQLVYRFARSENKGYLDVAGEAAGFSLLGDWARRIDAELFPPQHSDAQKIDSDFAEIESIPNLSPAERTALRKLRLGQGRFRDDLLREFDGRCAASGLQTAAVLRASHILPWCQSRLDQKRDPKNGLLLSANLDALFDSHLITFDADTGELRVAPALTAADLAALGPVQSLSRRPCPQRSAYLRRHNADFELAVAAHARAVRACG